MEVDPKKTRRIAGRTRVTRRFSPRRAVRRSSMASIARVRASGEAGRPSPGARRASRVAVMPAPPPRRRTRSRNHSSSVPPAVRSSRRRAPRSAHQAARAATSRRIGREVGEPVVAGGAVGDDAPAQRAAERRRDPPRVSAAARRNRRTGPFPATSSAGVPEATTRPWSTTTTRSASRSTSASSWVVRRIVRPAARRSPISPRTCAFAGRVHPGGRLVEDQQLGPPDERAARARDAASRRPKGACSAGSRARRGRGGRGARPGPPGWRRAPRGGGRARAGVPAV